MAAHGEADQLGTTSDSDQGELNETDAPGKSEDAILFASDDFDNLTYEGLAEEAQKPVQKGTIHAIVRQSSNDVDSRSNTPNNIDHDSSEVSAGEESVEETAEQAQITPRADNTEVPDTVDASRIEIEEEDAYNPEWKNQKKHVFILSASGKPIYSRHGKEDKLVTIMGVMQALVSFVQDAKDQLRSIVAGQHKFVFLVRDHLILVGVTRGMDSTQQMLLQLMYVYNQVISVLTHSSLNKIFKQRRNYDLRRLLTGAEKFFDNLLNLMDTEPGLLLTAVRCLPLDSSVREIIAQSIVQNAKLKDLVFALIIVKNQLVTLVRMKKYYLHPMDLHLIINLVNASESFKDAESWTPICLPKFDASGFVQAHVSYLDNDCEVCLLLLSVDRDSFFILSEAKDKIKARLIRYNALQAINASIKRTSYSTQQCGIPDLRHFLYKARSTAQYTSPELEAPYTEPAEQERLFGMYLYLHHRIHTSGRPLKILFHVGEYETLLGWVTQGFELYAVFGPLITKTSAIHAVNKLLRWIKREEDRLFILNSVTF
ncbi:protein SAND-like [Littorina saxatilis]|uniref:Vacuolar fusion protein MON1 homolog n=1 Tax=Littorina saxatilis TaxID=31220 RepID=A0AAN9GCH3_9CAEN